MRFQPSAAVALALGFAACKIADEEFTVLPVDAKIADASVDAPVDAPPPPTFAIAYLSNVQFQTGGSFNRASTVLVINVGPNPLKLIDLAIVSVSDDDPDSVFSLTFNTVGTISDVATTGEVYGQVTTDIADLITPLFKAGESRIGLTRPSLDLSLTGAFPVPRVVNATAVLQIGDHIAQLGFVFDVQSAAGQILKAANRVDSKPK